VRLAYESLSSVLAVRIAVFEKQHEALLGIADEAARGVFVQQLVDSVKRETHFAQLLARPLSESVTDPRSIDFDPLRAAIVHKRNEHLGESFWMAFLFTHFGKSRKYAWGYPRVVYGRFGSEPVDWWTWESVYSDPTAFQYWLHESRERIQAEPGGFGNHRKYTSLDALGDRGTGAAVVTYTEFVASRGGTQESTFGSVDGESPEARFDRLYKAMKVNGSFGRTAKFDHLTTLRRLGLANIRPPHTYMEGATGPLKGARLLFDGDLQSSMTRREAQEKFVTLGGALEVGPDIVEDAACNWQKSPLAYKRFTL